MFLSICVLIGDLDKFLEYAHMVLLWTFSGNISWGDVHVYHVVYALVLFVAFMYLFCLWLAKLLWDPSVIPFVCEMVGSFVVQPLLEIMVHWVVLQGWKITPAKDRKWMSTHGLEMHRGWSIVDQLTTWAHLVKHCLVGTYPEWWHLLASHTFVWPNLDRPYLYLAIYWLATSILVGQLFPLMTNPCSG